MPLSRLIAMLLTAALLAGCATIPPVTARDDYCGFTPHLAQVPLPPPGRSPTLIAQEPANALLLLSGGGQNGAFGAGLLTRWQALNGGLPRFRTVTGISTGALIATDAFVGTPEGAERAYRIVAETELLRPYARRSAAGGFGVGGYLSILRHNAVADLAPLRAMLMRHLSMAVMREVVAQSYGRRLLIGAVDVDLGDAVIFDLVEMAQRAVDAAEPERAEHWRGCYIDAIVASASVPLAARPVFIDNRMYIDGGARFGLFLDAFGTEAGLGDTGPRGDPPAVYMVVNGVQQVAPECGKADARLCAADGSDPPGNRDGAHRGWNLLGLAQRSSDILIAQVYRFSAADVVARYRERYGAEAAGRDLHYFAIDRAAMLAHRFEGTTCAAIHAGEEARLRPLQFYPRYMACLIDYGHDYADANAAALGIRP